MVRVAIPALTLGLSTLLAAYAATVPAMNPIASTENVVLLDDQATVTQINGIARKVEEIVAMGSCGRIYGPSDLVAAVKASYFQAGGNPNNDPICNKHVVLKAGSKTVTVQVTDKCMGCTDNEILITKAAMLALGAGPNDSGIPATWQFV